LDWKGNDMTVPQGSAEQSGTVAKRHRAVAVTCAFVVLSMIGLSFAAVPLYRLYCQATGFAGTTQKAEKPSDVVLDRTITLHFDANVARDLTWHFEPVQRTIDVKIGENVLAFYRATNTSDRPLTGTAVFNVTPEAAGIHFNKVECFCFTEQRLEPGQSVDMPVSFFVDPAIVDDEDANNLLELTLSYTFFRSEAPVQNMGQNSTSATRSDG
jgi:cytochrome c oxidase assembly protein subunit 11